MSYNWNVYKLFKNGRRAKAPFHVFEYDDPNSVGEYFDAKVKENFTEKIRRSKLLVLRSDLPQERQADMNEEGKKLIKKNRNRVFRKLLKSLDGAGLPDGPVVGGLIFCRLSGWKWQWAALESGTSRYLAGISPGFASYDDAQQWMTEEIEKL